MRSDEIGEVSAGLVRRVKRYSAGLVRKAAPTIAAVVLGLSVAVGCGSGGPGASPTAPSQPPQPAQPRNVAGLYVLILEASNSCVNMPSHIRQRIYTARVTQNGAEIAAALSAGVGTGAEFSLGQILSSRVVGTVSGDTVSLSIAILEDTVRSFTDLMSLTGNSATPGTIRTDTSGRTSFAGTFTGTWDNPTASRGPISCTATDHGYQFRPQ